MNQETNTKSGQGHLGLKDHSSPAHAIRLSRAPDNGIPNEKFFPPASAVRTFRIVPAAGVFNRPHHNVAMP
jgi:hypothetical protein